MEASTRLTLILCHLNFVPKQGFREAARKAKPVLLEPIMKVEVITPDQYMGDVTGDLNRRRGMLEGMDTRAGAQVIKAKVPLSEMFGYVTQLRSLSSGRASLPWSFLIMLLHQLILLKK